MEIVVVIAIMVLLAVLTIESFSKIGAVRSLDTNTQQIALELEKARSLTLASQNDAQYGVHLASTSVTLFEGATYNAGSASTTVTYLNPSVTISSLSLTGGNTDIVFSRLTGKTAVSGTITVSISGKLSSSKTLVVYPTGVVEIQ